MSYDAQYSKTKDVFGRAPAEILREHVSLLSRDCPILDVGAGQGRNTLFAAREGLRVDAIDPSAVAIDTIRPVVEAEPLPVRTYCCGFETFSPQVDSYSGILLLGVIQILCRDSIDLLVGFGERWLQPGGLLLVTAFTTADASYADCTRDWRAIGPNSFTDESGDVRTYLEPRELMTLFSGYEAVHYWEGLGREHRHGEGPMQRHAMVEAVLRRR